MQIGFGDLQDGGCDAEGRVHRESAVAIFLPGWVWRAPAPPTPIASLPGKRGKLSPMPPKARLGSTTSDPSATAPA